MDKVQFFFSTALQLPPTAIEYFVSQSLAIAFPKKAVIESDPGAFNVEAYAQAQLCTLTRKTFIHNQMTTYWRGREPEMMQWHRIGPGGMHFSGFIGQMDQELHAVDNEQETMDTAKNAWLEVEWQGAAIDVITMNWINGGGWTIRHWIMADSEEIAREFFVAVCKWNTEIRSEVLVFDSGQWYKDEHLFQSIKGATFDNLILRGDLKQDIHNDLQQFFAARETYEEYGIPWKRGILFVGPPGNGKTHTVKALINSMEQPCLYVKSFRSPHGGPDELCIRQVFDRARRTAPCILVLEDLDSLLTSQNRSFFLNELDGFAVNIGIVTLATTNHPERLDPAILDRPSRFDRKYPFDLPEQPERQAYITLWNNSLKPSLRLSDEGVVRLSTQAEDFSFAYLKELFLSSMMRWISNPQQGTMEQVMTGQVDVLREQMVSATALAAIESPEEFQMPPGYGPMMSRRMHMRRGV